jgi:protein-disulfide isomerase/uncharacterized membrane protein
MISWRQILFILLAFAGFVTMFWSANDWFALNLGERVGASFCSISAYWNCDRASFSVFGAPAGIPLGIFGAAWFIFTGVIGISNPAKCRNVFRIFAVLGIAATACLGSYLLFVLKTGCIVCYFAYLLIIVMSVLGWNGFEKTMFKPKAAIIGIVLGFLGLASFAALHMRDVETKISEKEFQAYFASLRPIPVPLISPLQKGDPNAKITVVEFSDFACPYCAKAAAVLVPYFETQKDVRVVFFPFPLDSSCNPKIPRVMHRYSCEWSKIALCANEQGKFWPFHDRLFSFTRMDGELPSIESEIDNFGFDRAALDACMENPETESLFNRLIELGNKLGVQGTPKFYVNGRHIRQWHIPLMKRLLQEFRK